MPSMKRYHNDPLYRKAYIEKKKEYYRKNKEKIKEKMNLQKIYCSICEVSYNKSNDTHLTSMKHELNQYRKNALKVL